MRRRESDFLGLPDKREPDPGWQKLKNLFTYLINRHGRGQILDYLDKTAGVAPIVIENWLNNMPPSPAIQNIIVRTLKHLPANHLPVIDEAPPAVEMPINKPLPEKHRLHTPTAKELLEEAQKKKDRLAEIMANMAIKRGQGRRGHKDVLPGTADDTEIKKE